MKQPVVYIMASKRNGTIYIGVTSDLVKRVYVHKSHLVKGFTSKYNCNILVFYELFGTMEYAITREKQLKGWVRKKKLQLIESMNPNWLDLYDSIV